MYNVIISGGSEEYISQLESLDIWERHGGVLRITHKLTESEAIAELPIDKETHILIIDTDESDGFGLLKRLNGKTKPPCVILTGEKSDFDTVKKALVLGAFDYLVKPVNEEELFMTLKRAAEKLDRRYHKKSRRETNDLCAEIVDCMLEGGSDLDMKINMLLNSNDSDSSEYTIRYSTKLRNASEKIYGMICRQLKWISDLIPEPELFIKDLSTANIYEMDDILLGYIYGLSGTVKKYSPPGLNGVTKTAVDYILDNRFTKLTLADTAKNCFVNKAHLSHVFKQNLGLSFTEYVSGLKMEMLRKMMVSSTKQLSEIADILGYDDYKYMGRIFKSTYGIAPSEFRNSPDILPITE